MMIPYIEILAWNAGKTALAPFALVEPSECWFELSYYELGEFEIYAPATPQTLSALQKGNFAKIPHLDYIWVILSLEYTFNKSGGRMVLAKGFEAKWVAGKRIIRDPYQMPTNLQNGMNAIFSANLGANAINARKIQGFSYSFDALSGKETDAQATRGNLLDFTQNLLKLHRCGTISTLAEDGKILFSAINGQNRTDTVIFSQSFDNLISATYYTSDEDLKTNSQIVSTFSENDESHDYVEYSPDESSGASGIERAEITIQSNLSTKVTDENGDETELSPTDPTYKAMQKAEGAAELAKHRTVTEFNGEIDLAHSPYIFGIPSEEETETDKYFFLGDIVGIRDEYFGILADARVTKYTFKQDARNYGEFADYGTE